MCKGTFGVKMECLGNSQFLRDGLFLHDELVFSNKTLFLTQKSFCMPIFPQTPSLT